MDKERYHYIVEKMIPRLNADILCLNEVVPGFLRILEASDFVRENYFMSISMTTISGYDSVMLSRWRFMVGGIRRNRLCLFKCESGDGLIIGALHLAASEADSHMRRRVKELHEIKGWIQSGKSIEAPSDVQTECRGLWTDAQAHHNSILMGDMNFHNLCETDNIYSIDHEDVWLNLKGLEDEGYTWDPKENQFIRLLLPLDDRRMRLDRIMVGQMSRDIVFTDISIFGREGIGISRLCHRILPSDHYGLEGRVVIGGNGKGGKGRGFDYYGNRDRILNGRDPNSTGFRSIKKIIVYRYLCIGILVLLLLSLLITGGYLTYRSLKS